MVHDQQWNVFRVILRPTWYHILDISDQPDMIFWECLKPVVNPFVVNMGGENGWVIYLGRMWVGDICFFSSGCSLHLFCSCSYQKDPYLTGVGKCPNFSHHPTIGDIISFKYLKVMWNKSPTIGTFTNPCLTSNDHWSVSEPRCHSKFSLQEQLFLIPSIVTSNMASSIGFNVLIRFLMESHRKIHEHTWPSSTNGWFQWNISSINGGNMPCMIYKDVLPMYMSIYGGDFPAMFDCCWWRSSTARPPASLGVGNGGHAACLRESLNIHGSNMGIYIFLLLHLVAVLPGYVWVFLRSLEALTQRL